jgi:hypothetical protein
MNEYGILMKLLTRSGDPIGASVEDMLDALGLPEDVGRHTLFQRLAGLSRRISGIGLEIKHNPVYGVFYVDAAIDVKLPSTSSPLPDRLAATLLVVITLAYQEGGWVGIDRVRKFRRKSRRGVVTDLKELQSRGYAEIDQEGKRVKLGPRASFEMDYESFFSELGTAESRES